MSKLIYSVRISRLKIAGVFLLLVALWGGLGFFGLTGLGRGVYWLFERLFGRFGWIGLVFCVVITVFLWQLSNTLARLKKPVRHSRLEKSRQSKSLAKSVVHTKIQPVKVSEGSAFPIPLPPTKLVPLKGFEDYFADPDLLDAEPAAVVEEIKELGNDFPSYFGEGNKFAIKTPPKLNSLSGLRKYFQDVEREVLAEAAQAKEAQASTIEMISEHVQNYPGQVAQLVQMIPPANKIQEKGVTVSEREMLLGKQKTPSPLVKETIELPVDSHSSSVEPADDRKGKLEDTAAVDDKRPKAGPFVKKPEWELPNITILDPVPLKNVIVDNETAGRLETVLQNFGVKARIIRTVRGPVITRHELAPAPGVKISRIVNLADDISLALAARDVRIEAPIPGKAAIGIEVPNKQAEAVTFREVLETGTFQDHRSKLRVALGKDIGNQPVVADLSKMPHLLIAGATGAGKSVCITTLINSLLFNATPDEVKLLMVDPKMVELSQYNGIAHLLAPVVTDPKKAAAALKWIVKEMENRYEIFAGAGVRDIERYNRVIGGDHRLPLIVVIIDELADLMLVAAGDVEESICRLAQMARAAGIHLVIATQRPSVDVITGIIKANIPSRISFAVSSQIDSRTILDTTGAEKLLGKGDMLYSPQGVSKPVRVQGCYVSDDEVDRIIKHWQAQGRPEYLDPQSLFAEDDGNSEDVNGPDDELFFEAGKLFITTGMASVSFLQRKLKLSYARAARLMDLLEEHGVVGGYEGTKPRQILITLEEFVQRFGNDL